MSEVPRQAHQQEVRPLRQFGAYGFDRTVGAAVVDHDDLVGQEVAFDRFDVAATIRLEQRRNVALLRYTSERRCSTSEDRRSKLALPASASTGARVGLAIERNRYARREPQGDDATPAGDAVRCDFVTVARRLRAAATDIRRSRRRPLARRGLGGTHDGGGFAVRDQQPKSPGIGASAFAGRRLARRVDRAVHGTDGQPDAGGNLAAGCIVASQTRRDPTVAGKRRAANSIGGGQRNHGALGRYGFGYGLDDFERRERRSADRVVRPRLGKNGRRAIPPDLSGELADFRSRYVRNARHSARNTSGAFDAKRPPSDYEVR